MGDLEERGDRLGRLGSPREPGPAGGFLQTGFSVAVGHE